MLIIANSLAKGFSGVSVSVVERLVDFFTTLYRKCPVRGL